jgi:predicted MFS family arabinose efflux permease
MLTISLLALPFTAGINTWLAMVPIALWGSMGWALQVPQKNQLISAREGVGSGNVAVALNVSALNLSSAIGAAGGLIFTFQLGGWALPFAAASVAGLGLLLQLIALKSNGTFSANKPACCSAF